MSSCICVKCGAEANSKCPYCRTVFPDNEMDGIMSNVLKHHIEKVGDYHWMEVRLFLGEKKDLLEAAKRLHNILDRALNEPGDFISLEELMCHHDWVLKPGMKSTIGCGHKGEDITT